MRKFIFFVALTTSFTNAALAQDYNYQNDGQTPTIAPSTEVLMMDYNNRTYLKENVQDLTLVDSRKAAEDLGSAKCLNVVLLGAALIFYAIMDTIAVIEVVQKAKKVKERYKTAQKELENAMNQFTDDVENRKNEFENEMNFAAGNAEEIDVDAQEID